MTVRGTVGVETAVPLSGREGDCGRGNRCTTQWPLGETGDVETVVPLSDR